MNINGIHTAFPENTDWTLDLSLTSLMWRILFPLHTFSEMFYIWMNELRISSFKVFTLHCTGPKVCDMCWPWESDVTEWDPPAHQPPYEAFAILYSPDVLATVKASTGTSIWERVLSCIPSYLMIWVGDQSAILTHDLRPCSVSGSYDLRCQI